MRIFKSLLKNQNGATAIEYGILASLVALAISATLVTFGETIDDTLDTVGTAVDSVQ